MSDQQLNIPQLRVHPETEVFESKKLLSPFDYKKLLWIKLHYFVLKSIRMR